MRIYAPEVPEGSFSIPFAHSSSTSDRALGEFQQITDYSEVFEFFRHPNHSVGVLGVTQSTERIQIGRSGGWITWESVSTDPVVQITKDIVKKFVEEERRDEVLRRIYGKCA